MFCVLIFKIFEKWSKHARLEQIYPYVFLFQWFTSNRPFIFNNGKLINKSDRQNILRKIKINLFSFGGKWENRF